MDESEGLGVKRRAVERGDEPLDESLASAALRAVADVIAPVLGIAEQRVVFVAGVDTDLVRAARLQREANDGRVGEILGRLVVRRGRFSVVLRDHSHPLAVVRVASDGPRDGAARRIEVAPHDRAVAPLHGVRLELGGERAVHPVALCHHEQARRALVQPVHDPGPDHRMVRVLRQGIHHREAHRFVVGGGLAFRVGPHRCSAHMVQQRVDERARTMPGRRMHDHARRLVHDKQILVFVSDLQRNGLRLRLHGRLADEAKHDPVAGLHGRGFLRGLTVDPHVPLLDGPLNLRARRLRVEARQVLVQPVGTRVVIRHHDLYDVVVAPNVSVVVIGVEWRRGLGHGTPLGRRGVSFTGQSRSTSRGRAASGAHAERRHHGQTRRSSDAHRSPRRSSATPRTSRRSTSPPRPALARCGSRS